ATATARRTAWTGAPLRPKWTESSRLAHGNAKPVLRGDLLGTLVARVDVSDHTHTRVVGEHSFELLGRERCPVRDRDLSSVDGAADADASAVVDGDPGRPARRVDQGVEQRPVGDGVGTVPHALGLPVRGRHGSAVEMVATDHDWRGELASGDHLVEPQSG